MYIQQIVQATIKENIKVPQHFVMRNLPVTGGSPHKEGQ